MSPTALFTPRDHCACSPALLLGGEGVPGVGWNRVGAGRAIPVYYPPTLRDPYSTIFSIFKAKGPTHGQIRLNLVKMMRFPEVP